MNKELKIGLLAIVAIITLVFGINYLKGKNILNIKSKEDALKVIYIKFRNYELSE